MANQASELMDAAQAVRTLKERPNTPIWDIKLIVNRFSEDDFEDKAQEADGDRRLDPSKEKLLRLVSTTLPSFDLSKVDLLRL